MSLLIASETGDKPFQSRYVAYARAHGQMPAVMLAHDKEAWPGGCMAGYIIWIGQRWQAWHKQFSRGPILSEADHAHFDKWLDCWVKALPTPLPLKSIDSSSGESTP